MVRRFRDEDGIHDLAERLRIARFALHLTQDEAANITLISQSAISLYEQARREPYVLAAKRMAEAYGVTMDWLLSLSDDGGPDILRRIDSDGKPIARRGSEEGADADVDPDSEPDPDAGSDPEPDPESES